MKPAEVLNDLDNAFFLMQSIFPFCSYLHYGLLAARAEILKIDQESGNPCLPTGYVGELKSTCYKIFFFISIIL